MSTFNIQNKAENVVSYVFQITNASPKKLRVDVVPKMRDLSMSMLENIVRANQTHIGDELATMETKNERLKYQDDCLKDIRVLEAISEIVMKFNYITQSQFSNLTKLTCELYDMVKKWRDNYLKR